MIVILSEAAFQAQRRISASTGPSRKPNRTTTTSPLGCWKHVDHLL